MTHRPKPLRSSSNGKPNIHWFPEFHVWRKLKCYFGFHDIDGPTDPNLDSFYYCVGNCGTHIRWEQGLPRYGGWATFGKIELFMVEVK